MTGQQNNLSIEKGERRSGGVILPILAVLLMAAGMAFGQSFSTNKTFMLNLNNALPPNGTNFFAINSNLLNAAVTPNNVTPGATLVNISVSSPTNNTISASNLLFTGWLTNQSGLFGVDASGNMTAATVAVTGPMFVGGTVIDAQGDITVESGSSISYQNGLFSVGLGGNVTAASLTLIGNSATNVVSANGTTNSTATYTNTLILNGSGWNFGPVVNSPSFVGPLTGNASTSSGPPTVLPTETSGTFPLMFYDASTPAWLQMHAGVNPTVDINTGVISAAGIVASSGITNTGTKGITNAGPLTNVGNIYTTGITVTNGITNAAATASTLAYWDANKQLNTLANATGFLYNDGSGALAYNPVGTSITNWANITFQNGSATLSNLVSHISVDSGGNVTNTNGVYQAVSFTAAGTPGFKGDGSGLSNTPTVLVYGHQLAAGGLQYTTVSGASGVYPSLDFTSSTSSAFGKEQISLPAFTYTALYVSGYGANPGTNITVTVCATNMTQTLMSVTIDGGAGTAGAFVSNDIIHSFTTTNATPLCLYVTWNTGLGTNPVPNIMNYALWGRPQGP